MTDDADPGRDTADTEAPATLEPGSGALGVEALGLEALGLEASDDPSLFATTARQKVFGSALGIAGLAAFVALGAGAIAGVSAFSWLWSYLLLSFGAS